MYTPAFAITNVAKIKTALIGKLRPTYYMYIARLVFSIVTRVRSFSQVIRFLISRWKAGSTVYT